MEILSATSHPQGGHVFSVQFEKSAGEYLRVSHGEWYHWPSLKRVDYYVPYEYAMKEWEVRARYKPALDITPPLPKGDPRRCMFCRDDMSGLAAYCLACGGAMHLVCSREAGDKCLTPGCAK